MEQALQLVIIFFAALATGALMVNWIGLGRAMSRLSAIGFSAALVRYRDGRFHFGGLPRLTKSAAGSKLETFASANDLSKWLLWFTARCIAG